MGKKLKQQKLKKEDKSRTSFLKIIENEPKTKDEKDLESLIFGKSQPSEHNQILNEKKAEADVTEQSDKLPEAAWIDEDDEDDDEYEITERLATRKRKLKKTVTNASYSKILRKNFEDAMGKKTWAAQKINKRRKSEESEDESDIEELLKSTDTYLTNKSGTLSAGLLHIKRVTDANKERRSKGQLRNVEFHPNAQVFLSSDKVENSVKLFEIDGKYNPLIQTVELKKCPIYSCHFTKNGKEILIGSKGNAFHCYDMIEGKINRINHLRRSNDLDTTYFKVSPCGKYFVVRGNNGFMHVITTDTKERIDSLKMNGKVLDFDFNSDGSRLYSCGNDAEVYIWDLNRRQCLRKFIDEGALIGTSIAASKNGQYLACGSSTGVINIYDQDGLDCGTATPSPVKSLMNLTTSCTLLKFNNTSEILACASESEANACKLVHVESLTVFSNFPPFRKRLGVPTCLDFSLNSGYFSVGNRGGRAFLFRCLARIAIAAANGRVCPCNCGRYMDTTAITLLHWQDFEADPTVLDDVVKKNDDNTEECSHLYLYDEDGLISSRRREMLENLRENYLSQPIVRKVDAECIVKVGDNLTIRISGKKTDL
ncbi:DgyrCDS5043 [Dimorphilus gyrociliatus]|uniref:U3 small nucleolar RNA-associated protein 18 homolog n=1 Tax=Dimorphilus gyrociliatus TaxID=2664684 RepID=A0A7I8VK78_9ANNE|nr:DgyrCDS5043 [Dimorphilus gyrociliatus]